MDRSSRGHPRHRRNEPRPERQPGTGARPATQDGALIRPPEPTVVAPGSATPHGGGAVARHRPIRWALLILQWLGGAVLREIVLHLYPDDWPRW